ncbi:MAG: FG-GAP-like repeat-containing protein [bacterium]
MNRLITHFVLLLVLSIFISQRAIAQFKFQDVTEGSHIDQQSSGTENVGPGVIVFDVDNDGWDDLYLPGGQNNDKLYRNNHDGTFTDIATGDLQTHYLHETHTATRAGTAFDFDGDGKTDLYICAQGNPIMWKNLGNLSFKDVTSQTGLSYTNLDQNESNGASFGDFDGDGDNDLFVARWVNEFNTRFGSDGKVAGYAFKGFPNWFYVNNGDGTFTEHAKDFGVDGDTGCSNIALFFDYDRDGDLDLIVGNDFGVELMPNRVYKNMLMETGVATFERVDSLIGLDQHLFCMGICPNDFNRDGNFDFYETTAGQDHLMMNHDGMFTNVSTETHASDGYAHGHGDTLTISWTPLVTDFDNDGLEDVFITHGFIGLLAPWIAIRNDTSVFLHNDGAMFTDVTSTTGIIFDLKGKGASAIDYDHDGKVDIVLGSMTSGGGGPLTKDFRIFHNTSQSNEHSNWMQLKFTAKRTAKEGIGTIVDVWAGGIQHSRQISTGGGQGSCAPLTAFVGLGNAKKADSINVFWPADKNRHRQIDHYENIFANHVYTISENMRSIPDPSLVVEVGSGTGGVERNVSRTSSSLYPNPAVESILIRTVESSTSKHYEIFDQLGVRKLEYRSADSDVTIPINSLVPGYYVLRISTEGTEEMKSFIKE